jgi:hypothetical protein
VSQVSLVFRSWKNSLSYLIFYSFDYFQKNRRSHSDIPKHFLWISDISVTLSGRPFNTRLCMRWTLIALLFALTRPTVIRRTVCPPRRDVNVN